MKGLVSSLTVLVMAGSCFAAQWGMKAGDPGLKSAGPLVFGKDGVLFVGDPKAAAIIALDTGDRDGDPNEVELHAKGIDKQIAKALQVDSVQVNDLAVNPATGVAFLSVSHGEDQQPAIVKVLASGKVEPLSLAKINHSKVELPDVPADALTGQGRRRRNRRPEAITDLAFTEGKVLVSGIRADQSSTVRELVFPFLAADKGINVEIYHGAHGRFEDNAAVRTFVPFNINGEPHLLAGFQCTPLVKFPVKDLKGAESVRGTTVAELGNRNRPLDMIVYQQDGEDFLLVTNTSRGVMKVSTADIERAEGIEERISGTAGQAYETIESLKNVEQLDRLNQAHALVIAKNEEGSLDLHTIDLP